MAQKIAASLVKEFIQEERPETHESFGNDLLLPI